jgi:hypothetical protein
MGFGPDAGEPVADRGAGTGHCPATAPARFGELLGKARQVAEKMSSRI